MAKIQVTQEDIEQGERGEPKSCAVARAIRRTFNVHSYSHVFVAGTIEIGDNEYKTPAEVIQFVGRFDSGCAVEPFEFELPI